MSETSEILANIGSGLREIIDPELGCNIVELGLVYEVRFEEGRATVVMSLTTPGCPMQDYMVDGVTKRTLQISEVDAVDVKIVWEPAWTPEMMHDELKQRFQSTNE